MSDAGERSVGEGGGEDIVLPAFIEQCPDGVFVDLTRLQSGEELERIVDRIFTSGRFFRELDYSRLTRLMYDFEADSSLLSVRIAAAIAVMPEARRDLYRAIKIIGDQAEYCFEPAQLETSLDVPVYGTDDNGATTVVGMETKIVYEPTELDFDEFVAQLWVKGLRFGIDERTVRAQIQAHRVERCIVAAARLPTESVDAGVREQTSALHRDNAPRRLVDGRVDLQQFGNRFPQISQGTRLLMKTPRQLGEAGRRLDGVRLEPRLPEDFDLQALAGEGTEIEQEDGKEFIVAAIDGFLNIDSRNNTISVTRKIINREGVSARTTGNLALQGDEYEEFGEVQEGRTVEGRNLTFHADVYGNAVSAGGTITLLQNISGGSATARRGTIDVQGLASNATLQAPDGTIRVKRAENCLIMANRIEAEWIGRCVVVAEESIEVTACDGSALAGKSVHVAKTGAHGNDDTVISMLLPDLSAFDRIEAHHRQEMAEYADSLARHRNGIELLTNQPEIQRYLALAGRLQRKEIKLTPQQADQWHQFAVKLAPLLKRLQRARDEMAGVEREMGGVQAQIDRYVEERRQASAGISCTIDEVVGETTVRPLVVVLDSVPLCRLPAREVRARLREPIPGVTPLFADDSGSFTWQFAS